MDESAPYENRLEGTRVDTTTPFLLGTYTIDAKAGNFTLFVSTIPRVSPACDMNFKQKQQELVGQGNNSRDM